jgi:subtilisin family serine protease
MKKMRKKKLLFSNPFLLITSILVAFITITAINYYSAKAVAARPFFKSYYNRGKIVGVAPDRVIVKYKNSVTEAQKNAFAARRNVTRKSSIRTTKIEEVTIPKGATPDSIVSQIQQTEKSIIDFAEVDKLVEPDFTPNDPSFSNQWHLTTIQTPQSWDKMRATDVKVAVCDTGFEASHPDLGPMLLSDLGYNTVDNNTNWAPIHPHGTMTAGTIAAITNNGIGVSGVTYGAKIIPVRVSNLTTGSAYFSDLAECISYSADHGARVINLSYSGVAGSAIIDATAQYAESKGAVVVVAAGNYGIDLGYPNYNSIVVASATDQADHLASFSCFGADVDVGAPGVNILTTTTGGTYASVSGTSFASPITAGVLALIFAARPDFTPAQAKTILFTTVDDIGATGYDQQFGYGRVNAYKAVSALVSGTLPSPTPTPIPTPPSACGTIPNPYPTPIPYSTTDWIHNPTTMYCSTTGNDFTRFSQLEKFRSALEWYYLDHDTYPACDCTDDWSNIDCLRGKLSLYLYDPIYGTDNFVNDNSFPYRYRPYDKDATNNFQGYCLGGHYDSCSADNRGCPLGEPNVNYQFHEKERPNHDIMPYRYTKNSNYTQSAKDQYDIQRKSDIAKIVAAMEKYKQDKGYYPQVQYDSWRTAMDVEKTLIPNYLSGYLSAPPDGDLGYNIRMWNKDGSGNFTKYCVATYMENVSSCQNNCGLPLTGFDCYGVVNSNSILPTPTPTPPGPTGKSYQAPTLSATVMGASEVHLYWNDVTGSIGTRYYIYRNNVAVHGVLNATDYLDNSLSPETTYTYTVQTFSEATGGSISPKSNSVSVTTYGNSYVPTPIPTNIPQVTIHGKFIDYFTRQPVINVKLIPVTNAQYAWYSDSNNNGEFSIQTRTDHLSNSDSAKTNISFVYYPDCYYYADWLLISKNNNGTSYLSSNPFDLTNKNNTFNASGNIINTGDITLWPAINGITVNSDKTTDMTISYPEEQKSYGQTTFSTTHQLGGNIIPFNYPIHVTLKDKNGTVYTAPTHTYDRSLGCQHKAVLNFYNGVFTWE